VLDSVPTPGGGFVATELVAGTPLEEVARRRAPLPAAEAAGYAVELLDAVITVRRHVPGAGGAVVGSAMVGTDGRVRVTRFSRPPGGMGPADAAVVGTAETLRDLLSGSRPPAGVAATIDDALAGRIASPEEMRGRLLADVAPRATAVAPPPPAPGHRSRWAWIVAAILGVLAVAIAVGIFLATRDEDSDRATVPDVAGATAADAVQTLRDAGFSPQTVGHASDDVARGIVISTSPAGGQEADAGSRVTVSVSQGSGDVAVPTVVGLTRDEAVAAVEAAGLESRVIEQPSATATEGTVVQQDPSAGLQVPAGSTVAIGVAVPSGTTTSTPTAPPATVAVPDVTGLSEDAAAARITAAGLTPGRVTQEEASGVPAGQVVSQSPAAGTQAAPRSEVDVTVASGG
jgi:beta-lactam-binding protein with PASTA domain